MQYLQAHLFQGNKYPVHLPHNPVSSQVLLLPHNPVSSQVLLLPRNLVSSLVLLLPYNLVSFPVLLPPHNPVSFPVLLPPLSMVLTICKFTVLWKQRLRKRLLLKMKQEP
jgi:hypothetical protein